MHLDNFLPGLRGYQHTCHPSQPSARCASTWLLPLLLVLGAAQLAAAAKSPLHKNGRLFVAANITGAFQIYIYSQSGAKPRPVTTAAAFTLAAHPALSPDGALVAFSGMVNGTFDVYVADAATGANATKLTASPPWGLSMVPAWSPDGKKIAFESDVDDVTGRGYTQVYVMDAVPGSPATRMTFSAQNDMGAKFSPDGKTLAFASDRGGAAGSYDIYLMDSATPGAPATRLTTSLNNSLSRSWSPDGAALAANSNDAAGAGRIVLVSAVNGSVVPITQTNARWPKLVGGGVFPTFQGGVTPAFSPDGRYVAYCDQAGPAGRYHIFRIRADGRGRPKQLTKGDVNHVTLGWQPVVAAGN